MRTSTIVSLGASALLGVGALVVAKVWMPSFNHSAQNKTQASAVATVPVVVASSDIPYGTKLDANHLTVVQMPANAAPRGTYSDANQILTQTGGAPLALIPISAREPVLASKLSGGGARPTVAAIISDGMRAYTIGVSDTSGVGGHVLPGDRVDIVLTRDLSGPNLGGNQAKRLVSDVVLQNVRILGMDLNHDQASTAAAVAHTATLEVNVQDAEKLAVAAQAGTLSMALRRTGAAEVAAVRTIQVSDIGSVGVRGSAPSLPGGVHVVRVAHRHPVSPMKLPEAIVPASHTILVVHGAATSTVDVPQERYGAGAS